jgi:hypothetical protein
MKSATTIASKKVNDAYRIIGEIAAVNAANANDVLPPEETKESAKYKEDNPTKIAAGSVHIQEWIKRMSRDMRKKRATRRDANFEPLVARYVTRPINAIFAAKRKPLSNRPINNRSRPDNPRSASNEGNIGAHKLRKAKL